VKKTVSPSVQLRPLCGHPDPSFMTVVFSSPSFSNTETHLSLFRQLRWTYRYQKTPFGYPSISTRNNLSYPDRKTLPPQRMRTFCCPPPLKMCVPELNTYTCPRNTKKYTHCPDIPFRLNPLPEYFPFPSLIDKASTKASHYLQTFFVVTGTKEREEE